MPNYPTPHIDAAPGDFGKTVLMPGDPKRARVIAGEYLEGAVLVNDVRGVQGYTGRYEGVKISVMASGMGMPSMGIYSYELFSIFGVDNIIRVGSIGALQDNIDLYDIIVAASASTNSAYGKQYGLPGTFAPAADWTLLRLAADMCESHDVRYHVGGVLSSDTFYDDDPNAAAKWAGMGVLGIEMEAAALYMNAARLGKKALTIATVSDHIMKHSATTAAQRQESFTQMMEIALDVAAAMGE